MQAYASGETKTDRRPQFANGNQAREGKYLTFHLRDEEYGIQIAKVKEIIRILNITKIPQSPRYVRGVVNLRGKVIPVIDLCLKFSMEASPDTEHTCIVVVDICRNNRSNYFIGIIVDSVSEVINIRSDEIEDTPEFGISRENDHFLGMAKIKREVKILLDIDRVLNDDLNNTDTQIQ